MQEAAGACNLEVDLDTGDRRYRGYQLQGAWKQLTGCEAALVVNNNAAATVLALQGLCAGREVVISRGQLIEIGGSFRLPDIFVESGAALREIGTTNRTHLADYEKAIGPYTAAILRVHPSNYRIEGFTAAPETGELATLAHSRDLICIDDIGSGCLVDVTQFGLPSEPTFQQSIAAGADLVLGSGDKLLGGPQCGILLGRAELITRLRDHPLARAFRVDKLKLAALQATLDAYLRGTAVQEIPTLSLLAASPDELLQRAERIAGQLRTGPLQITVSRDTSPVGGGSLPGATLPTAVLRIVAPSRNAEEFSRHLRTSNPRVYGRVQQNEVVLDLRSVPPEDDSTIVEAIRALSGAARGG
jgi:L-seryl-tRNA(Ser) seleniumtransferase